MALNAPRWIVAAVAGCLSVLAIASRVPDESERTPNPRRTLTARVAATAMTAHRGSEALRAMVVRDSVVASLARLPRSDSTRFVISSALTPPARDLIRVMRTRLDMSRTTMASPITVAFVHDIGNTILSNRFTNLRVTHALPATASDRCLAIVRMQPRESWFRNGPGAIRGSLTGQRVANVVLGPCAFYEAFGMPGPAIGEWLASGGHRFATLGTMGTTRLTEAQLNSVYRDYYWNQPSTFWLRAASFQHREQLSGPGIRCASGDVATCRQLILAPGDYWAGRRTDAIAAGRLVTRGALPENYWGYWTYWNVWPLGQAERALLADMARDLGPDRFRQFWTSQQEPGAAFEAATGEDIGAWVLRWSQTTHGVLRSGPGVDLAAMGYAAALILLATGASVVAARRRQIS